MTCWYAAGDITLGTLIVEHLLRAQASIETGGSDPRNLTLTYGELPGNSPAQGLFREDLPTGPCGGETTYAIVVAIPSG
jgi:hypothetical protein